MMTIQELRKVFDAEPFEPFVLHLEDGRSIPVVERIFMAVAADVGLISVYSQDDASESLDFREVAGIEVKPELKKARQALKRRKV